MGVNMPHLVKNPVWVGVQIEMEKIMNVTAIRTHTHSSICETFTLGKHSCEQKNCLYKHLRNMAMNGDQYSNSTVDFNEYLQIFFRSVHLDINESDLPKVISNQYHSQKIDSKGLST